MQSPRNTALLAALAMSVAWAVVGDHGFAAPKVNQRAQGFARLLGPSGINANSGDASHIAVIRARAIPILEVMEHTYRTNGPSPASLIENAYDLRRDVGPYEKIVTGQILIAAWREASAMGLFDENRKFKDRISDGRFSGQSAVFEHIIPAEVYPAGSTHLANFRIVAPDKKREAGAALTPREEAFKNQLAKVMTEIERGKTLAAIEKKMVKPPPPKVNAVGQTAQEAKRRWQQEVDAAGDLAQQMPGINIEGRVTATPSHMNKNRWRVTTEIQNRSAHPTEVQLEYWMIGITDKKRDHYLMAKGTETLHLRKGEEVDLEFFTRADSSYKKKADDHDGLSKEERKRSRVRMRGIVIRVNHAKGVAATFASDRHLIGYVDDEDSLTIGSIPVF